MIFPPVLRSLILYLAPSWATSSERILVTQQLPGSQAGTWYCKMGINDCWEAIGPIQESFKQISAEIKRCLRECGPPDDAIVTWSVYMIGKSRDTAVPTILICSSKKKVRKMVRGLIEENRILDQCTSLGFNIGDCSIAPDHYRMPLLNDTAQMLSGDINSASTGSASSELAGAPVWCTSAGIEAGMKVFLEASPYSNEKRFATIGSVFSANGKHYATTVGHLFESGPRPQPEEGNVEFEFDIAGDEESDFSSDFVVKINQFAETCVMEGRGLHNDVSADNLGGESQGSVHTNPTEPALEMALDQQHLRESNTRSEDSGPMKSLMRLGRVVFIASNDTSSDLDYAVIEIDHDHVSCADHWKRKTIPCVTMAQTTCQTPRTAEVEAKTGSGGRIKGRLCETPTFIRFPYSAGFREVWTVRFDKPLSKGDCGSMVTDFRTGQLYGHIVAGSPLSGVAYIVPAHEIFNHISKRLGLELEHPVRHEWNVSSSERVLGVGRLPVRGEGHLSNLNRPLGVRQVLGKHEKAERTYIIDGCSGEYSRQEVLDFLDSGGIPWRALVVAALGFFTDSYSLFATNVIVPLLAILSASDNSSGDLSLMLNVASLCGVVIGQVLSGVAADVYGRRKTYGLELLLVIIGTLGMVTSSDATVTICSSLVFWRFVMGVGIGGDYPLSAIITAEFAPQRYRAKMMTLVSLSQPLGQLFAGLASSFVAGQALELGALGFGRKMCDDRCMGDYAWRFIIALGLVPTAIAVVLRLTIPESPRYTLDVADQAAYQAAAVALVTYNHDPTAPSVTYNTTPRIWMTAESPPNEKLRPRDGHLAKLGIFLSGFRNFMWDEGNWRYLAGTSICWMLFDFAFYGLGMYQPDYLAETLSSSRFKDAGLADWSQEHSNSSDLPMVSDFLHQQASASLLIPTIGVLTGSCVVFFSVNYLERRKLQVFGFVGLFAVLLFLGVQFSQCFNDAHSILVPFLIFLSHVFFNIGPNSTTFILPAELFPTRYRGTAYGLSAAIGKIGSIVAQFILRGVMNSTASPSSIVPNGASRALLLVSALMLIGAFITWQWVPEPQWNDRPDVVIGKWRSTILNRWIGSKIKKDSMLTRYSTANASGKLTVSQQGREK